MKTRITFLLLTMVQSLTFASLGIIDSSGIRFVAYMSQNNWVVLIRCPNDALEINYDSCKGGDVVHQIRFHDFSENLNAIFRIPSGLGGTDGLTTLTNDIERLTQQIEEPNSPFEGSEKNQYMERLKSMRKNQYKLIRIFDAIYKPILETKNYKVINSESAVSLENGSDSERVLAGFRTTWFDGVSRIWSLASAVGSHDDYGRLCRLPFRSAKGSDLQASVNGVPVLRLLRQSRIGAVRIGNSLAVSDSFALPFGAINYDNGYQLSGSQERIYMVQVASFRSESFHRYSSMGDTKLVNFAFDGIRPSDAKFVILCVLDSK